MYNVYIVSYIKATLFSNSVSILYLISATILANLGNSGLKWTLLDIQTFKFPREGNKWLPHRHFGPSQLLKCCPSFPQSYQSPHMCSNKNIEVKCAISARDDNHAHF